MSGTRLGQVLYAGRIRLFTTIYYRDQRETAAPLPWNNVHPLPLMSFFFTSVDSAVEQRNSEKSTQRHKRRERESEVPRSIVVRIGDWPRRRQPHPISNSSDGRTFRLKYDGERNRNKDDRHSWLLSARYLFGWGNRLNEPLTECRALMWGWWVGWDYLKGN